MNVISSIATTVAVIAISSSAALAVPPAQPDGKTPSITAKSKPMGSTMHAKHPHGKHVMKKKAAM